jgi:Glycosyl transferase family 2
MKLVEIVVVHGDPDVADAHIAYHLNAGVDFVIALDHESGAGTTEILESYERDGYLRLMREGGEARDAEWRTRMGRVAAAEHGADWVINSEAEEFWWPRGESLKDVLAPIPPRYTIVQGLRRSFLPRPGEDGPFSERMTLRRLLQRSSDNGPESLAATLRPIHRADSNVVVQADGTVTLSRSVPLRAWYPIEVLHFPARASEEGDEVEREGSVVDTRLRDALRALREAAAAEGVPGRAFALPEQGASHLSFRTPDVVDDAAYAVECAAVGEVDLPRLEQYVAELEERVAWLEQRLWPRVLRAASKLVRRPIGGRDRLR